MGLIATGLMYFGAVGDTMGVGAFIGGILKNEGQTASELFKTCFTRAVNRNKHRLGKLTETNDGNSVSIDSTVLDRAIDFVEKQIDATNFADQTSIASSLCPYFRDAVVLPGSQLTSAELDNHITLLLTDAFADFYTKLPAYPTAISQSVISHIVREDAANRSQAEEFKDLQDTLRNIVEQQKDLLRRHSYLDAAVIQQESTRPEYKNPFRNVKAEDFNHDYDRLAALFKEPSIYDDLRGPDNLIIAGGRGCGKSMLLRSLSALTALQLQRIRAKDKLGDKATSLKWRDSGLTYFGVYIKLARGYFYEWSPDCKLTNDAAIHLFQHVFNMLLLRSLVDALVEAENQGVIQIGHHAETRIVKEIAEYAGFPSTAASFVDLLAQARREERQVNNYIGALRLGGAATPYGGTHTSIHEFIDFCCKSVLQAVSDLKGCRIFFLLDEYENLAEFQQRVVNTLAKLRPLSLSIKIAARALGVKSVVDLQGEPIQRPRDYHVVELDYNPNDAGYRELLFDIASKRLEAEGFVIKDIRKLLLEAPRFHPSNEKVVLATLSELLSQSGKNFADLDVQAQREKLHQWSVALVFRLAKDRQQPYTYAGFDDFADLSSGIISSFLEFCKLAFYLAQAEGTNVHAGNAIPWKTQNEAVYLASRAYFEYIERNVPETGAAISRLILDLADVFREKLLFHGSEPEASRLMIKDPGTLDGDPYVRLAAILDDAVRWSVLHAVGEVRAYFPKHKTEVRSDDYLLNRVLAPILRISPRPRWRCPFTVPELAALADQTTRSETRNALRLKHKGETSEAQLPSLFDKESGQ
jgi:hypothetical protein